MSTEKVEPWGETWELVTEDDNIRGPDLVRGRMMAAAPQLVRALLAVEWSVSPANPSCPFCGTMRYQATHVTCYGGPCDLDAALTAAGLPDQASRDEVRRAVGR